MPKLHVTYSECVIIMMMMMMMMMCRKMIMSLQVFEVLKERSSDWIEKIKMVEGSLEQPDLGISEENLQSIIDNVSVVFHVAATVKFDAQLRYV